MDNGNLEKLFKLGLLHELISKSKEIIQTEGFCGGYRGCTDELLGSIENEIYREIEDLKSILKE